MALFSIPVDNLNNDYTLQVSLDNELVILRLRYNNRDSSWYLSVSDTLGNALTTGKKLSPYMPLTFRHTENRLLGDLMILPTGNNTQAPTLTQLGTDYALVYLDQTELA